MDVITLGETMVLFTPNTGGMMRYANQFSAKVGGAESNVAIGLARLGHNAGWMSRLGDDELGKKVLAFIRGEGVDTSQVTFDTEASTGLYFKERLTANEFNVKYYRKDSAASRMEQIHLNESYIAQSKYLHITGITPALSKNCYETVIKAMDLAKQNDVPIVFDPNLRRKLWSESEAKRVLLELAAKADIVLPGIDEGKFLFDVSDPETMAQRFNDHGAKTTVIKLGKQGAYYAAEEKQGFVQGFPVDQVVDPVGAGDGFAAGFISGLLDGLDLEKAVQRANAVGAIVTMVSGDVEGLPEKDRLLTFINGSTQDDVKR
ncbi:sugar kinase [Tuberibacillus sp. Marseille-P3662]|uniref:sugar kinase n=1 Tax=Tuberibacillus sp. Marseille-P3662 TaxID=1965358 RepID=UPI000A1C816A|nr:sugar kinase [Tuberibacillus sp. Marseille-P3662]